MIQARVRTKQVACPVCKAALCTLEMALLAHLKKHVRQGKITIEHARLLARQLTN